MSIDIQEIQEGAAEAQETVAWAELADRLARQSNERAAE